MKVLIIKNSEPGHVAQLVVSPTADPGVASSILARSHTSVEIDHENFYGHSVQHYKQSKSDSTGIMLILKKLLNSNHQVFKLLLRDPAHANTMKQTCAVVILALTLKSIKMLVKH